MDMMQLENLLKKPVPARIKKRTLENVNDYSMILGDAFEEAARTYAKEGTELYKAWYNSDFRAFLPSIYYPKYLDFNKYPLAY